jgi:hypothetical protein
MELTLDLHTVDFITGTPLDTDMEQDQDTDDVDNWSLEVLFDEEDLGS